MENKRIQLRAYPNFWLDGEVKDYYLEYRIIPEELNWFKRIFCNGWKNIHRCVWDSMYRLTMLEPEALEYYKNQFKTLSDIHKFEEEELIKANDRRKKSKEENDRKARILY